MISILVYSVKIFIRRLLCTKCYSKYGTRNDKKESQVLCPNSFCLLEEREVKKTWSNQISQGFDSTVSMYSAASEIGWCKRVWGGETVGLGCVRRSFLKLESEGLSKGVTSRMKQREPTTPRHQERALLVQKTAPARDLSQEQAWPMLSCWRAHLATEKWNGKKSTGWGKRSRTKSFRVSQADVHYFPSKMEGTERSISCRAMTWY